jgi:hypothetical protein
MTPIGDVEQDLARRVCELAPNDWTLDGARPNVRPHREIPPDGSTPDPCLFVELTTVRHSEDNDTATRAIDVQLLHRFSRAPSVKERNEAIARMRRLYDVLHRSGDFIGAASAADYADVRCIDAPVDLEDRYISLNVTMWRMD